MMIRIQDHTRRRFLQIAMSGLGTTLATASNSSETSASMLAGGGRSSGFGRAKACILLYMDGGPSHIDMFDMKPHAPAEVRGPFTPIATSVPGTHVCEHLPRLAPLMDRVLQIRSVCHRETVHDPAVYQMLTGYEHISSAGGLRVEPTDKPHLGSAFAQADRMPVSFPRFVHTPDLMRMQSRVLPGQTAGILPSSYDPLQVYLSHDGVIRKPNFGMHESLTIDRLRQRETLLMRVAAMQNHVPATRTLERLQEFRGQVCGMLGNPAVERAFDLECEDPRLHDRYGRFRQGQSTLLARRLVEAGARFVTVYWGNEEQDWADGRPPRVANNPWDTHRNHFPLSRDSLIPRADQTLSALLDDLRQRGMLDDTLVVWMGDFGRTPRISQQWASRDHWPGAFTILMAGAGVRGGHIIGATDGFAAEVTAQPVSPADITATILHALGVRPHTTVRTSAGAVHQLSTGDVVDGVFA